MCLLIKYRCQVADVARLGTGCPGRSGERRQSLLASWAGPVRTTYATSHTEARSGLGPVVASVGNTELGRTQASPRGSPGGDRAQTVSLRVARAVMGGEAQRKQRSSLAQRRLPRGGDK